VREPKVDILVNNAGAAISVASRARDHVIGSTLTVDGGVAFAAYAAPDLVTVSGN
jgi:hypothetical protein